MFSIANQLINLINDVHVNSFGLYDIKLPKKLLDTIGNPKNISFCKFDNDIAILYSFDDDIYVMLTNSDFNIISEPVSLTKVPADHLAKIHTGLISTFYYIVEELVTKKNISKISLEDINFNDIQEIKDIDPDIDKLNSDPIIKSVFNVIDDFLKNELNPNSKITIKTIKNNSEGKVIEEITNVNNSNKYLTIIDEDIIISVKKENIESVTVSSHNTLTNDDDIEEHWVLMISLFEHFSYLCKGSNDVRISDTIVVYFKNRKDAIDLYEKIINDEIDTINIDSLECATLMTRNHDELEEIF